MIKILIVEDDVTILETLKITLADEGYDIDATTCGAEALGYITKKPYDIVISDMNLGDTTGLAILKAIRNINRDIKFIVITGYSSIETAVEAIRAGIFDYIIKPFDVAELRFRVKQAVSKLESDSARKHIEERYRIIMHHIPFGIAILSPEMEILEANEQIKEWFPSIINTETPHCYTVFRDPPGDGICADCIAKQIIVTGKSGNYIIPWERNGKNYSLKFTLNPVFDDGHKMVNILAVIEKTG